jgi:hypothetical protein
MEHKMSGACGMHGGKRNALRVLVWQPEGKRPLGRPKCAQDNIKILEI